MKTTKLLPANTTPAMLELYKLLLKSEKFLNWKPERPAGKPLTLDDLELERGYLKDAGFRLHIH